jgi:hypothetical protein
VDFCFLRKIIRPVGLIVIDDYWAPSVRTAVHDYEQHLGWTAIPGASASGRRRKPLDDGPGQRGADALHGEHAGGVQAQGEPETCQTNPLNMLTGARIRSFSWLIGRFLAQLR